VNSTCLWTSQKTISYGQTFGASVNNTYLGNTQDAITFGINFRTSLNKKDMY
ncbi:hypothetical protein P7K49_040500, partial [Saguinus oedipus]